MRTFRERLRDIIYGPELYYTLSGCALATGISFLFDGRPLSILFLLWALLLQLVGSGFKYRRW